VDGPALQCWKRTTDLSGLKRHLASQPHLLGQQPAGQEFLCAQLDDECDECGERVKPVSLFVSEEGTASASLANTSTSKGGGAGVGVGRGGQSVASCVTDKSSPTAGAGANPSAVM